MFTGFFNDSSLAGEVEVKAAAVVHRREMDVQELKRIEETGLFLDSSEEKDCALEINGLAVAEGKIVKKRDGYYLKVTRISKEENDG